MVIFYLLFMFFCVSANYITENQIVTNFRDKQKIINLLTKPSFYYKYLDIVDAKNIIFIPKIEDPDSEIKFPQSITYYSVPKINFLPSFIKKMRIDHTWTREGDIFFGNIKTKYLEFNMTIEPILKKQIYLLNFEGTLIKKNFLIPEKYLDQILKEFGEIFLKITEC